ncbi:MAG TPA: hypothetical protein VM847_08405, partial [Tahibacter sp.]|nr:hypothetical protein [Tahibacter sp.]
ANRSHLTALSAALQPRVLGSALVDHGFAAMAGRMSRCNAALIPMTAVRPAERRLPGIALRTRGKRICLLIQ